MMWPQLLLDESFTHSQSHAIAASQPLRQEAKQPLTLGACTDMSTKRFPCISTSPELLNIQTR